MPWFWRPLNSHVRKGSCCSWPRCAKGCKVHGEAGGFLQRSFDIISVT